MPRESVSGRANPTASRRLRQGHKAREGTGESIRPRLDSFASAKLLPQATAEDAAREHQRTRKSHSSLRLKQGHKAREGMNEDLRPRLNRFTWWKCFSKWYRKHRGEATADRKSPLYSPLQAQTDPMVFRSRLATKTGLATRERA